MYEETIDIVIFLQFSWRDHAVQASDALNEKKASESRISVKSICILLCLSFPIHLHAISLRMGSGIVHFPKLESLDFATGGSWN